MLSSQPIDIRLSGIFWTFSVVRVALAKLAGLFATEAFTNVANEMSLGNEQGA